MKKISILRQTVSDTWSLKLGLPGRGSWLSKSAFFLFILLVGYSRVNAQYCIPAYMSGCSMGNFINTFTVTGVGGTDINNVGTGCFPSGYDDRTTDSVSFDQGGVYTANINTGSTVNVQVYIDFNDNFLLDIATEVVGGMNGVSGALSPFTITIPLGAALGPHRMRVISAVNTIPPATYPNIFPCPGTASPIYTYGETHDYVAVITSSTPSCPAVTGLTAGSITSTGATVSWTAATGSVGYKYVTNTTAADPTVAGTFTTTTSYSATGLTAATTYYAHVRDTCGPGSVSAWTTYSFTTASPGGCGAVTGLTASGVTNTSATVSWTGVTGSVGYQYLINTTAAAPTGSGTVVLGTSISPSGLTPSTVYYAHVRDSCGATNLSAWVTVSFTTTATAPSCLPVTGAASSGVTSTSATVSWTAMTGSVRYKYVVNTTAADPIVPGTATTLNSFVATGLSGGTTYFAHVRDSCGPGNVSSWVTVSFTTPGSSFVNDVASGKGAFISVFPNPVTGLATLKINGVVHSDAHLYLFDMAGRLLNILDLHSATGTVDMSAMAAGMYICRYTDSEMTATTRIVKE